MMVPPFWRPANFSASPRPIRASDAASCAGLHATSFAHPWSVVEFETLLSDPACCADGIEERADLAGFILSRRALDEAEVLTVVVAAVARRKGCGRRLLAAHIARLASLGVRNLFLEVDEANQPALALYRRFGFAVEGRRKNYYTKSSSERSDALVMRRSLN